MSEWKEYTGSDEQIEEMENAQYGVLLEYDGEILDVSDMVSLESYLNAQDVTHYLICEPHPYAGMIKRWADTGQPVYCRSIIDGSSGLCYWELPPFAHPDKFEYSFTPFE
jgi:hypothetical protein